MKVSYCGEYTTYSQKVRNLIYSIKYYRDILNDSNMNSSNLSAIFGIEHILEGLSNYKNKISKKCQGALNDIRNIRTDNGSALFKKRHRSITIETLAEIINSIINIIENNIPYEERTDKIQEIILSEQFLYLEGAIARCSRKIAQIISSEMKLIENENSHKGKTISEEGANR